MSQSLLHNPAAERAVLSGVCSHGIDAFVDVDGIVEPDSFVIEEIKESITAANPQMTDRLAKMAGMRPNQAPVKLGMRGQKPQKDIV